MPAQDADPIIITFGGGLNARRRPLDLDINECARGENFSIDPQLFAFQRRRVFDLAGTAPNAGEIRGFAQRVDRAGNLSTLIQAAGNVYEWDGASSFTLRGTVAATAKLRGHESHNWKLGTPYVIITDLNLAEVVKTWDGTTLADFGHNLSAALYAKYCRVTRDRAWFANVTSGSAAPHVVLGSEIEIATNLTTANKPSSSLGFDKAFYLIAPDLGPINGLETGFGQMFISTDRGQLWRLAGSSAFDFEFEGFYERSGVSGDEAMVNVGNDILLGLPARIETLSGTLNFGDVRTDDATIWIKPLIERVTSWRLVYDRRTQKVYCFPDNQAANYVFHKPIVDDPATSGRFSPWSKWRTTHNIAFQPTTVWAMRHPTSKQDRVYMGDGSGRIFVLDGDGGQDGGSANVTVSRTSKTFRLPDARIFDVRGWINYAPQFSATVTLTFEFGGAEFPDQIITVSLPDNPDVGVYDDSAYYDDAAYYSTGFGGRLRLHELRSAGVGHSCQVKCEVTGAVDVEIHEIGLIFRAAQS